MAPVQRAVALRKLRASAALLSTLLSTWSGRVVEAAAQGNNVHSEDPQPSPAASPSAAAAPGGGQHEPEGDEVVGGVIAAVAVCAVILLVYLALRDINKERTAACTAWCCKGCRLNSAAPGKTYSALSSQGAFTTSAGEPPASRSVAAAPTRFDPGAGEYKPPADAAVPAAVLVDA